MLSPDVSRSSLDADGAPDSGLGVIQQTLIEKKKLSFGALKHAAARRIQRDVKV